MKITLLHYSYAPVIAGVELVMEQHARLFVEAGHSVTVLCAPQPNSGTLCSGQATVRVVPLPELARQRAAAVDPETPEFTALVAETALVLRLFLRDAEVVFVHNVLTMPFHLACTAALWQLADELPTGRIVSWVHDIAAADPERPLPSGGSWSLLRSRHPGMCVVAVSDHRASQFAALTGTAVDAVIPNGIDPLDFLNLTPAVAAFAAHQRLLHADVILLQPARILRRKNIELGMHLLDEMRGRGCRAKLLVTGAPDEHNADSTSYHAELLATRAGLNLETKVLFISEFFPVTKADLISLYAVSDVLWFPSRQEGFGLPVLEGALHRLPIFCADVPPMNSNPLAGADFFDPFAGPGVIADGLFRLMEKNSRFLQARHEVVRRYAWDTIWPEIQTLLSTETRC